MRWLRIGGAVLVGLLFAAVVEARADSGRFDLPDDLDAVEAARVLAAHHDHGPAMNGPAARIDELAAEGRIETTCGYVSKWAELVLEREGFEVRLVDTLTLDEWNTWNNGHTMIEVRVDGRWVVFDLDRDVWFWRDGAPLSLIGYVEAVAAGEYEVRPLAPGPHTPTEIRGQDERLIQVPMIRDGETIWFFSTDPDRVESYSDTYRRMGEAEWRERFYTGVSTSTGS